MSRRRDGRFDRVVPGQEPIPLPSPRAAIAPSAGW